MEATSGRERLLLFVLNEPPAGLPRLPHLADLAQEGFRARVRRLPASADPWAVFATGMAGRTGQEEEKTFWHLLQQAGKQVALHAVAAPSEIWPAVTAGDLDFCLVTCNWRPEALSATGRLTVWQAFDEVLARIKADAEAQTAVMVLGLPTPEDEGLLIAGGGFFAAAGDIGTVDLLDVAPTVLWLAKPRTSLDVLVGGAMPGRVLDEIWAETGWSDEEREVLSKHLQGLGYLA